jgi:hypothetical protein
VDGVVAAPVLVAPAEPVPLGVSLEGWPVGAAALLVCVSLGVGVGVGVGVGEFDCVGWLDGAWSPVDVDSVFGSVGVDDVVDDGESDSVLLSEPFALSASSTRHCAFVASSESMRSCACAPVGGVSGRSASKEAEHAVVSVSVSPPLTSAVSRTTRSASRCVPAVGSGV